MKVALCIGHSRWIGSRRDNGAVSVGGVSEWEYNMEVANLVEKELVKKGHGCMTISDYGKRGYTEAIKYAAQAVKDYGADAALELHFNAAHGNARGHEWLFLKWSDKGLLLAGSIEGQFNRYLPELKKRGVKGLGPKDRGYSFCKYTHCPAVVCEPFFGSNQQDWQIGESRKAAIAKAYVDGLLDWWADMNNKVIV